MGPEETPPRSVHLSRLAAGPPQWHQCPCSLSLGRGGPSLPFPSLGGGQLGGGGWLWNVLVTLATQVP